MSARNDLVAALDGAAGAIVPGTVMHVRMGKTEHRFTYSVFSLLVDVDRIDELAAKTRGFSHNRFDLAAIHDRDHGPRDGTPLGPHIRRVMRDAGCEGELGTVLLLCYPRILGYVFNPLSVYYVYDTRGALAGLVYEVRNTFGEMHTYAAPLQDGERSESGIRQTRNKLFFVSPFIDMHMVYRFRMGVPGEDIRVRILETENGKPLLAATFAGSRQPFTAGNLLSQCMRIPFMTFKVITAIHFEALRLWWKGAPFFWRSAPPPPVSFPEDHVAAIANEKTSRKSSV